MKHSPPSWLQISESIQDALQRRRPVVALESTVITHGLPRPVNLDLAMQMEEKIRSAEVEPATVAVLNGKVRLGLSPEELEALALETEVFKINVRDLGAAQVLRRSGGTTVSATLVVAAAAGLPIFATGGIGGVHRGRTGDVSSDLSVLGKTPVGVVCSGAKSILDLPRTLEQLETAGVPVIGWQTDEFPAFFSHTSGLPVSVRVDTVAEMGQLLRAHWEIASTAALICVPCPEEAAVSAGVIENALEIAEAEAAEGEVLGKDLTPYLLRRMAELTDGESLRANLELLRNNAFIAAKIARALV